LANALNLCAADMKQRFDDKLGGEFTGMFVKRLLTSNDAMTQPLRSFFCTSFTNLNVSLTTVECNKNRLELFSRLFEESPA